MIDLFPFAGLPVAVLGLGAAGRATARALAASGAEVLAWDDDPQRRAAAEAEDIMLRELATLDWREPVSLVIEHDVPQAGAAAHACVAAARQAGCEVIADSELLARAQRDAAFVAVVSRRDATAALDLFAHVLQVSGRECEAGGDAARPLLELHPLDLGGVYVIAMPPARAALTLSVTFDAAVFLDLGTGAWPPCGSRQDSIAAAQWVFHRQSGPQGAVLNVDDPLGRQLCKERSAAGGQVVVPVSGRARAAGGVYVAGGVLHDDLTGQAVPVTPLPLPAGKAGEARARLAAAAYVVARLLAVPEHAAMASLRSHFSD